MMLEKTRVLLKKHLVQGLSLPMKLFVFEGGVLKLVKKRWPPNRATSFASHPTPRHISGSATSTLQCPNKHLKIYNE